MNPRHAERIAALNARAEHHRAGAHKARSLAEQQAFAKAQAAYLNAGRMPAARVPTPPAKRRPRLHNVGR